MSCVGQVGVSVVVVGLGVGRAFVNSVHGTWEETMYCAILGLSSLIVSFRIYGLYDCEDFRNVVPPFRVEIFVL